MQERVIHVDDSGDIPYAQTSIEAACRGERVIHVGDFGDTPVAQISIEAACIQEHVIHVGDSGDFLQRGSGAKAIPKATLERKVCTLCSLKGMPKTTA